MLYEPLAEESATEQPTGTTEVDQEAASAAVEPFGPEAREERLSELMLEVFNGEVGRGRSLKYWENLTLKPQHIQMIVMKAAGYRNSVIAERFSMTQARVSVILNHPDAMSVLSRLVSFQAENLLDIKARIQAHAGEALDTVLTAMRQAKEPAVKSKIGFALLDRAGYGAVQKSETVHKLEMAKEEASGLIAALSESQNVQDADYEILQESAGRAGGSCAPDDDDELSVGSDDPPNAVVPPHGDQSAPPTSIERVA